MLNYPTGEADDKLHNVETIKASKPASIALLVAEMRPKQWVKNLIVLAPLLFSGKFSQSHWLVMAGLCVLAFSLISSSLYVFNDILDAERDRAHPVKCRRPIASGALNPLLAGCAALICGLAGFIIAFYVRPTVVLICLAYVLINLCYSLALKNWAVIDILCVASGFVLRAVAGAAAVHAPPSGWFLLCTTFGALFLALEKRRSELVLLEVNSANHRQALNDYSVNLIRRMETLIAPSLLTAYSFYTFQSFHGQWMMLTIPIVLYGVIRYQILSEKNALTGAPEDVFWKDRPIQFTLILWIAVCGLVIYGNPSGWLRCLSTFLDSMRSAS